MLADIKAGHINGVICKDLSRFGRNYVEAGLYIDHLFVKENIRFIAPGDGVDTQNKGFDISIPIRNIMNDMYARDASTKTRLARATRAKQGLYMAAKAPYGYRKDPDDRHHLLVDEKAAEVVRRIFQMASEGSGYNRIARVLHADGILNPRSYHAQMEPGFYASSPVTPSTLWHVTSVQKILQNPVYIGITAQGRREAKGIKGKQVRRPVEDWIIVEDTHEGLVSASTWEMVQKQITVRRRATKDGEPQMYAGLLYCSDCGSALSYSAVKRKTRPDGGQYKCWYYLRHGKEHCASHYITMDFLNQILLADINRHAQYASLYHGRYVEMLRAAMRAQTEQEFRVSRKDVAQMNKRREELDAIIRKLFEQNAAGIISDERFASMLADYEAEQRAIVEKLATLEKMLQDEKQDDEKAKTFAGIIGKYLNLKALDARILNKLVHQIVVYQRDIAEDGTWTQRVDISYKFIGFTHVRL